MTETTDVEMDVICAFCGEPKWNCACGRTAGRTFRIVHLFGDGNYDRNQRFHYLSSVHKNFLALTRTRGVPTRCDRNATER